MADVRTTGGCQCGAVRYAIHETPFQVGICHCRMCQKAFGSFGAALVSVPATALTWARGTPGTFRSSSIVSRGFCAACGTPLAYDAPDGLALTVLAFDDPDAVAPTIAYGVEGKRPWCDAVPDLPQRVTMDDIGEAPFLETLKNFQHPDHDTGEWPPNADR